MKPAVLSRSLRKIANAIGRNRVSLMIPVIPVVLGALAIPSCNLIGPALSAGLVKLQFGCLPQGTPIDTAGGMVKIEDLKSGDVIIGFGGGPVRVNQIHEYREDPAISRYLTVYFDNGSVVSASPRHRIDGKPAAGLKVGDRCGSHIVTRIGTLQGVSRSFDLLTDDRGYRIAGIPVNSMIEEMLGR